MKSFEKVEILRAAVCVVGADGKVTEAESKLIDKLAGEIGVGLASREAMLNRGKNDPDFCKEMFRVLKTDPKETMLILFQAAMVDRDLDETELRVLKVFAEKLGVSESVFSKLVENAKNMLDGN